MRERAGKKTEIGSHPVGLNRYRFGFPAGVFYQQHVAAFKKLAGGVDSFIQQTSWIISQVQDDSFQTVPEYIRQRRA